MNEYRVVWKRGGLKRKTRRYAALAKAERFLLLLGPEPWKFFTAADPDTLECCDGYDCGCGGLTHRQRSEERRKNMPALEYVRIEQREVGPWGPKP